METGLMTDEPPWPRAGCGMTASPLGSEEAVSAYPSPCLLWEDPPSIKQPQPPTGVCPQSPQCCW